MATKQNIYDIQNQVKDFFRSSDTGAKMLPQNPFNILWMLKEAEKNEKDIFSKDTKEYIKELEKSLENSRNQELVEYINKKSYIAPVLRDENLICKRMELLVLQGASVEKLGVPIVRFLSLTILQKAIELGLDVNYYEKGNYALRTAFVRNSPKIYNYLWNFPGINKDYEDMDGLNIFNNMIDRNACKLVKKLWVETPESFHKVNNNKTTALHSLNNCFNNTHWEHSIKEVKEITKSLLEHFINSKNNDVLNELMYNVSKRYQNPEFKNLLIKTAFEEMNKNLEQKEHVLNKMKL